MIRYYLSDRGIRPYQLSLDGVLIDRLFIEREELLNDLPVLLLFGIELLVEVVLHIVDQTKIGEFISSPHHPKSLHIKVALLSNQ